MRIVIAAVLAFLLDWMLGDPAWMPHPVVFMGRTISLLEKTLRKVFPETPGGEMAAGALLAAILSAGTFFTSAGIIRIADRISPALAFAATVLWGWQSLAMRGLQQESENVYRKLSEGTLEDARTAVARIVGRDTRNLSREGVAKAAIETVAENFSDGVAAPMFWFLIGGAPLALCYKAVNTMDSMIAYKTPRYLYFGRCAAKLDDLANWIPARISAFLLIAAADLCGEDGREAFRIWKRDRRKHASPNSAQTEAAMAGALRIRLAGPAYYFGELVEKPEIGDPLRPVSPELILNASRLMVTGSVLALLLFCAVRFLAVC